MGSKRQKGKVDQADTSEQLLELLAGIDRPTTICSFGDRPITLPGLGVKGIGPIGLPLGKAQARRIEANSDRTKDQHDSSEGIEMKSAVAAFLDD